MTQLIQLGCGRWGSTRRALLPARSLGAPPPHPCTQFETVAPPSARPVIPPWPAPLPYTHTPSHPLPLTQIHTRLAPHPPTHPTPPSLPPPAVLPRLPPRCPPNGHHVRRGGRPVCLLPRGGGGQVSGQCGWRMGGGRQGEQVWVPGGGLAAGTPNAYGSLLLVDVSLAASQPAGLRRPPSCPSPPPSLPRVPPRARPPARPRPRPRPPRARPAGTRSSSCAPATA